MRALAAMLALAATGCFDFSSLTECHGATAWLCDDLERGQHADAWVTFSAGTATATVDDQRSHAGERSLHVSLPADPSSAWVLQWRQLPRAAGTHAFVRAYVFVPVLPAGNVALYTMIETESTPPRGARVQLEADGRLALRNGIGGVDTETRVALPVGRWSCLEWELAEAHDGEMRLWLDDQLVAQVAGDTLPQAPLTTISVGAVLDGPAGAEPPFEVWFDDVVLDAQRITCRR